MPESDSVKQQRAFSGQYLEATRTDMADQYRAVEAQTLRPLPTSDVISYETVIYGLFADKEGQVASSLIETERPLKSRPEVIHRSIGELALHLSSHMTSCSFEEDIFENWDLSRQLMYETALSQSKLRFLGGMGIYQHEPRSPLKTAILYPEAFDEWIFHEREKIAFEIQQHTIEHSDITKFERELLTARPQTFARICGNAVLYRLTDEVVTEVKVISN